MMKRYGVREQILRTEIDRTIETVDSSSDMGQVPGQWWLKRAAAALHDTLSNRGVRFDRTESRLIPQT